MDADFVAKHLKNIIAVSSSSKKDIHEDFKVDLNTGHSSIDNEIFPQNDKTV